MVKYCIIAVCVIGMGALFFLSDSIKRKKLEIKMLEEEIKKNKLYYRISVAWIDMLQHKKSVATYLKDKGYHKIGIYGMRELGERLYWELVMEGIEITCVIDKSSFILGEVPFFKPNQNLPELDLIIVTSEYYYESIKEELNYSGEIMDISTLIGNTYGRAIV